MSFDHAVDSDLLWLRSGLIAGWKQVAGTVVLMLGSGIIFGLFYGLRHPAGAFVAMMNDRFLIENGAVEAPLLGLFLLVLHGRGWKPRDLRLRIGWLSTLGGLGLLLLTYLSICIVLLPLVFLTHVLHGTLLGGWLSFLTPHGFSIKLGSIHLSWGVIIIFTFLNAFYEELIYMSYLFNECAAKAGPGIALLATILVRLSIHTYQGTEHVVQMGIWSLIFGLWYWSGKKVWPLVAAHAGIDLISLGALKVLFGPGA